MAQKQEGEGEDPEEEEHEQMSSAAKDPKSSQKYEQSPGSANQFSEDQKVDAQSEEDYI